MKKKIVAFGVASLLVAGGVIAGAVLHNDVQLDIDGEVIAAGGFNATVADVLAAQNVEVSDEDLVLPSLDSAVSDGSMVTVRYARDIVLDIDGEPLTITTTALTLDEALDAAALADPEGMEQAWLSVSRSAAVPRSGLDVDVRMPKTVTLSVGGEKAEELTSTVATVADLLAEQNLTVGETDKLTPKAGTALVDDLEIVLDRVVVTTETKTEKTAFTTIEKKDSTLLKGTTEVATKGKKGKIKRTYEVTTVNGKETDREVVKEKVLAEPVDKVVKVGTKVEVKTSNSSSSSGSSGGSSSGAGINMANEGMWDRIAQCESSGDWSINTGNGYYGGLQFSLETWRGVNGQDFAEYPHQATRAEQITVANRLYAQRGTQPWSCA
ncbi:resuscitation-promoting factor [Tessaracoccus caeni]|uniref:resuscitation-promoting factor n=1 Tax=Tessaracoccus caeni TaxID=3031239 RepID=UPI0023DB4C4B|nr:resuscitation-promoting factor [Tessaracoccus caeni]MDF1488608.1 transglycosylase family protein [Tessaracoccus caeni]